MRERDENRILARLFSNLKGPKTANVDWIQLSSDVIDLKKHYGTIGKTAEKLSVSRELVRALASLTTLTAPVQKRVSAGEIRFDAAQRLATIHDPGLQERVAAAMVGLKSHDARQLVQFARRFPNGDIQEFRDRIVPSKGEKKRIDVLIVPLSPEEYATLARRAANRRVSPDSLVRELVRRYLADPSAGDS